MEVFCAGVDLKGFSKMGREGGEQQRGRSASVCCVVVPFRVFPYQSAYPVFEKYNRIVVVVVVVFV